MSLFTAPLAANIGIASLVTVIVGVASIASLDKRTDIPDNTPPIVKISEHELFKRPREVYERALAEHGSVIAVKRKGRLEYIVDDKLSHHVLTVDTSFSFEKGTAFVLNFHYFSNRYTSFFHEIDDLVKNAFVKRMPLVVEQVFPIYSKFADKLVQDTNHLSNGNRSPRYVHGIEQIHKSIAEAMILVVLGPEFVNAKNLKIVEDVANDISSVTGIYQNTSWWGTTFPNTWRFFTWIRVLFTTIPAFYSSIGFRVWETLRSRCFIEEEIRDHSALNKQSVLEYLAYKYAHPVQGRVSFSAFVRITALLLGIIFASIHQTSAVTLWIIYELAVHPEYIPELKEELAETFGDSLDTDCEDVTYDALQNAARLDSFIREVLRTKGDTLAVCRMTTEDTLIGGYTIPKGFLVCPLASLSHFSKQYHGPDAEIFNGRRWEGTGKQAAMLNQTYFPFGMGRWACPGRTLAIAEIKMIVWAILRRATPVLKGNSYTVPDPMNVTSVPPDGELTLVPHGRTQFCGRNTVPGITSRDHQDL